MGGTHRHRDSARPSSPILLLKCALRFPNEKSQEIDGWQTPPPRRCPPTRPRISLISDLIKCALPFPPRRHRWVEHTATAKVLN